MNRSLFDDIPNTGDRRCDAIRQEALRLIDNGGADETFGRALLDRIDAATTTPTSHGGNRERLRTDGRPTP